MKIKLHHPLWTHIPAVALLILLAVKTWQALPLPAQAPVHFGASGQPDRIGSPWELIIAIIGMGFLYMLISVFLDEIWARNERHKRFNWISFIDEIVIGSSGGILLDYFRMLKTGDFLLRTPVTDILMLTVPAVIFAAVLEYLRPYYPKEPSIAVKDTSRLEANVSNRVSSGQTVVHWESQHNLYFITAPLAIFGLGFMVASALSIGKPELLVYLFNGLLFIGISVILYGINVTVTPEKLLVRLDMLGIRVLTLDMNEIASVEVKEFSPLADFGGWGIRVNLKMKGYYWRGHRGVLLTMKNGKKYLIGSDDPERLAAVVKGMRENL